MFLYRMLSIYYKKKTCLYHGQLSLRTEQRLKEEIFKMAFAFEDFALKYGQYHLSESVPQLIIASKKFSRWKYCDSYYSNLGKKMQQYFIIAVSLR